MPRKSNQQMVLVQSAPVKKKTAAKKRYTYSTGRTYVRRNSNIKYDYPGAGRMIGSALGSFGAGFVPAPIPGKRAIGGIIGGALGQGAHALVKRVTGFGDYNVSKNSLIYNQDSVPEFSNNPRCTEICHREFISDIRVPAGNVFTNQSYIINPANSQTFPWLSQIATNYEEYVMQGLVFEFKTTSATAVSSTNTALGTVVMATQYNSLDSPFVNKQQMENYEFSQSSVPSQSILHAVECDPKLTANQGLFYVNNPTTPVNSIVNDPRLYNLGIFNIATVGMQAASTIGELWVTYKICLLKPRLSGIVSGSDHYELDGNSITSSQSLSLYPTLSISSTSFSTMQLFSGGVVSNEAFTSVAYNPWNLQAIPDKQTLYINPGYTGYLLVIYQFYGGSVTGVTAPTPSNLHGNVTFISNSTLSNVPGFSSVQLTYTAGNGVCWAVYMFNCSGGYDSSGASPSVQFLNLTYSGAGTPTNGNLAIYSVPSNLTN